MNTVDRRTRRTRNLLKNAFITLVLERGYAAIKVEDITETADLGRATFYNHYPDKAALFDDLVTQLLSELEEIQAPLVAESSSGFTGQPVLETFKHALKERDLYRIILRGEGDGRALRLFTNALTQAATNIFSARAGYHQRKLRIDAKVLACAWVGEQLSVLHWWLEEEKPLPVEKVTHMLLELSRRGRYWASGMEPS